MLEEHVLLNENDVLVSSARFVIDEVETYAMGGIVSITLERGFWKIDKTRLIIGLIIATFGLAVNTSHKELSLFLFIVGVGMMALSVRKYPHAVKFRTSSGEVNIYSNHDKDFVEKVFKALNDSIIFRG